MKRRRRLFPYILLNILVSALVTGTVVFLYQRAYPPECAPALPSAPAVSADAGALVNITGVVGAGILTQERMIIQNSGSTQLVLTGWTIKNETGITYTFPQLTLYPGARLQLHSMAGKDTPTDLYWGRTAPVWSAGKLAALYDAQNIVRAFYRVP